jgi:hypothetical protein
MYRAYMSLSAAAAIAYAALRELMHPGKHRTSAAEYEEAMGLIAAHVAIVVPVFGVHADGETPREISREIIAEGRFRWGGLRLEFDDGRIPYVNLTIRKADLDPILERLRMAYSPLNSAADTGAGSVSRLLKGAKV